MNRIKYAFVQRFCEFSNALRQSRQSIFLW